MQAVRRGFRGGRGDVQCVRLLTRRVCLARERLKSRRRDVRADAVVPGEPGIRRDQSPPGSSSLDYPRIYVIPGQVCQCRLSGPKVNIKIGAAFLKQLMDSNPNNLFAVIGGWSGWCPGMTYKDVIAHRSDCCDCQQNLD